MKLFNEGSVRYWKNSTLTLVDRTENNNTVDSRWIFKIKDYEFGNLIRNKAGLGAKGFIPNVLEDYNGIFASAARISNCRFLIAFVNKLNPLKHHMNIETVFLMVN